MLYSIGQVSQIFDLPVSTLRYYDKEGLFPNMHRQSGIRKFSAQELDTLHIIECLKKSGLEIKQIRQFMEWCRQGSSTYEKRRQLFETQKAAVEAEMERLQETLDILNYKCWYYETAIADGNEDRLAQIPDHLEILPEELQEIYAKIHTREEDEPIAVNE